MTGWNFYTGDDASYIGPGQYDFLTLATHELAHTVGLGESSDPDSVMYEYLSPGTVRRTFTDGNLAAINTNADRFVNVGAAALNPSRLSETTTTGNGLRLSSPAVTHPALIVGLAPGSGDTLAPVVRGTVSAHTLPLASPVVLSPGGPLALGSEGLFTRRSTGRPSSESPHSRVRPQITAGHSSPEPVRIHLSGQKPSFGGTPTGQLVDEVFTDGDREPFIGASATANSARYASALDVAWGIATQPTTTPRRTRPADPATD